MPVIVVANPKGGVGKSTVATGLAGTFARARHAVMPGDVDRQQSAARGATLWDIAPSRAERDLEQWQSILAWVGK